MTTRINCLLLISLVSSQVIFLPDDLEDITIEDPRESEEKCFQYGIIPVDTENYNMTRTFYLSCGLLATTHSRSKRFIQPIIDFFKKTKPESKKDIVSKMNRTEIQARATILNNLLKMEKFENISVEKFQELTNWNATQILSDFNYPAGKESDAWLSIDNKSITCDPYDNMELKLCGHVNAGRTWARKKLIVPLARFDGTGSIIKYVEMPKHVAVRSNGRMTLIKTCKRLSTYSECIDETASTCSPFNTTLCNTTLKVDEKKVFIRDFGEWTVVASFLKLTPPVELMQLMQWIFLDMLLCVFPNIRGLVLEEVPHVNADDIDSLEKQYGKKPILAESRKMLMSVQDDPVMSELPYVAIFLLGSVFILTSVLLALICCRYIRNRKDGKEKKEAVRVIYSNENCEIVV